MVEYKKHIEKGLDHKNLQVNIVIYLSDPRKHRYEPVDKPKKQHNRVFLDKELTAKVIMDFRTVAAHKFRTKLRLKQCDVILNKEQSVLTKIKSSFEGENMQIQYSVLGYRIDLYFHEYKLAIEFDGNDHSDRNIDYEKRQKAIEQELGCKFIRIFPHKEDFDIFKAMNEIFRYIKQSSNKLTKKRLIDKIRLKP